MVRSTLVTACRLAISPTRTSPLLENATTEGVVRPPSAFAMIVGSPPSRTATAELVVPRSMPTARAMVISHRVEVFRSDAQSAPTGPTCQTHTPQTCVHLAQLRGGATCSPD